MRYQRKLKKKDFLIAFLFLVGIFLLAVFIFSNYLFRSKDSNTTIKVTGKKKQEKVLSLPQNLPNPPKELKVPILMYHYVEDSVPNTKERRDLQVQATKFKEQLDFLKNNGYSIIKMEDLFFAMYESKTLPPKPVILTFDDGYEDAYQDVLPALNERKFSGVFFIITSSLGKPDYLTNDQLKEIAKAGMEIGAHTQTHPDLSITPVDIAKKEIEESKKELENIVGKKIYFFCYPSGKYNQETVDLVRQAGYVLAVNTKPEVLHSSSVPLELTRIRVHGIESLEAFRKALEE